MLHGHSLVVVAWRSDAVCVESCSRRGSGSARGTFSACLSHIIGVCLCLRYR